MKKNIRPEGPAKKLILLQFCPKKIFWPGPKTQAPLNIKWTVPKSTVELGFMCYRRPIFNQHLTKEGEFKIQKSWCTVTVASTIEHHGGHSRTPANQRWDQVPGKSQSVLLG